MNVVTPVVAPAGPERTTVEYRHVTPLGIHLHHPGIAMLACELWTVAIASEQLGHTHHTQGRAVVRLDQVLSQLKFGELFALVAQAVLRG
ncbi:hypothetical protein D3C81_1621470 [compost metagenome]